MSLVSSSPLLGVHSRMGWQCPKCNTVYSPDVSTCTKCTINHIPNRVVPSPSPWPTPIPNGPWVTPPGIGVPPKYTLRSTAEANSAISWTSGCGALGPNTTSDPRLMSIINGPNLLLEDDK